MIDVLSFPNTSIAGIFWAAILSFILPFLLKRKSRTLFIVLLIIALTVLALLIISNSRSGWLGSAVAFLYIFYWWVHIKNRKKGLTVFTALLFLFFMTLVFYKPGSSWGRKHIYEIAATMWKDNWVRGIGLGKFKAKFNEYQADYFSTHDIDSKRALLADNTFYAFNDYLQWAIERGLAGILSLVILFYLTVSKIRCLQKRNGDKTILFSAVASLICVAAAALFSYPLQIISIQAIVLLCLVIIAFYPVKNHVRSPIINFITMAHKGVVLFLITAFIINTAKAIGAKQIGKEAFELERTGYKTEAINKYRQLTAKYPEVGYNWFYYAQQLYYSNRLAEATACLDNCRKYYTDNKVYKLKADIELELKNYNAAEKDYLRTIYMVPNRMGSRVDLLNFYIKTKNSDKALYWAKSILNMPVKVRSDRVDAMLKQTKSVLDKLENVAH